MHTFIYIMNDFDHGPGAFVDDDERAGWEAAFARRVEKYMNEAGLYLNGDGEIVEGEGDEITWDIRHDARGTSYSRGQWCDADTSTSARWIVRGEAFDAAWQDAWNKAVAGC